MKGQFRIPLFVLIMTMVLLLILQISSCKKRSSSGLPALTTDSIVQITPISAACDITISSVGIGPTTQQGVCWNTRSNPTISDFETSEPDDGTGFHNFAMYNLKPGTKYFIRGFAINSAGLAYGNEISFTTTALYLGQTFYDGIVFYIDSTGEHGLLAATSDQAKVSWQNGSYAKTDATSSEDGFANTNMILSVVAPIPGNDKNYAAYICYDYLSYKYGPPAFLSPAYRFFLPSKDELNMMYNHKNIIGGFLNMPYWSSTETDSSVAWSQNFSNGNQSSYDKFLPHGTRAIRKF